MLNPDIRDLATAGNFAAFTVLPPSGLPMTHVMWVDADDEHVLINTEVHRAKFKAVELDPRVTVTVIDASNPYRYGEVRGRVVEVVRGEVAREHIDALSMVYRGTPYEPPIQSERVILRIAPEHQHVHNR